MTANSPRLAKTFKQICRLQTDHHDVRSGWIMIDGNRIILTNQVTGHDSTGKVEFTRAQFERLIDWYNKPQRLRAE